MLVVGSDDALLDGFTVTGAADGGLYSWGTSPTVRNSAIVGNTGGFIYGSGQFIDCIIANNQGGDGAFFSGWGKEKTSLVSGCAITNNSHGISVCGPVGIENSTIAGNSIGIFVPPPGGEGCLGGEALEMRNTIVWGNDRPSSIFFENANISHSLVEGIPSGNGNLNVDPLFVDAAVGDYHLRKGSPCIDAADGTTTSERDLDSNPRVDDPNAPNVGIGPPWVDMGAYEGQL